MVIKKLKIGVREKANRECHFPRDLKLERGAKAIWLAEDGPFTALGRSRIDAARRCRAQRLAF